MLERITRENIVRNHEFYQINKAFFVQQRYAHLPLESVVMYSLFYARTLLSEKRNFVDANDCVYFFYSLANLEKVLKCGKKKVIAAKRALIEAGLLEEEKTGRASRLYLKHVDASGISSLDIDLLDEPEYDETKISDSERALRSKNAIIQHQKHKKEDIISYVTFGKFRLLKLHEVSKRHFVHLKNWENFKKKVHEVSKRHLVHLSPLNQHSSKNVECTKCQNDTSEVSKTPPRYTELDRLDNNLDYILDHRQNNIQQNELNRSEIFNEQYLYDLKKEYAENLIDGLRFTAKYENIQTIHHILHNAMQDIFNKKFIAEKGAVAFSNSIVSVLEQIGGYKDNGLAQHIKFCLIRLVRYRHSGRQEVKNVEGYYYTSIQRAILEYVNTMFVLTHDDAPTGHIPLFELEGLAHVV